jgi:glycosyltransferase involved in cell wall biosynthesis
LPPFFSIVTISFNQAKYLRQCLESVVSQKDRDVEFIVVDAGSSDGSREILQSFRSSIDHLILEPDRGPADGLNKGFKFATGQIGYFINSDDFLLPGAVRLMKALWEENTNMEILLGGAWLVDEQGKPRRELFARSASLEHFLGNRAVLVQQGMSFKLQAMRKACGFNVNNRTCWDFELLCSMLQGGARTKSSQHRFGAFRLYDGSLSGGVNGVAHAARYSQDRARLEIALRGARDPRHVMGLNILARLEKVVLNPELVRSRLMDSIFPGKMLKRWESDMGRV